VAIKLAGDSDFKMGVGIDTSKCPRIKVRTLLYRRRDEPLVHSLNMGSLFRDAPSKSSDVILAENYAQLRAADELKKAWHDQPANTIIDEKCKLTALHEKQISAGVHRGRINLTTGLTEPCYVLDLPRPEELQQVYVKEKQKINLYLDRFFKVTSSMTPSACQRDFSEANFHIFTFGINMHTA